MANHIPTLLMAKLEEIVARYKQYERLDSDPKPKAATGQFWSPRHGHLCIVTQHRVSSREILLGIQIGSKFGEPAGYRYPSRDGWNEAREHRASIIAKLTAEVREILGNLREYHGGCVETFDGTAYSVLGWHVPKGTEKPRA